MAEPPIFQVRAVGSFEQEDGCPDYATEALDLAAIERLCKGECYNPSDARRPLTRLEVVRIRPQVSQDEDPATLIDDPWLTFACDGSPDGCAATFTDADFATSGRGAVYYARAFEAPKPAINAGGVRCTYDADGNCVSVDLCPGDGGATDDCLSPTEPRAWSSPIWVDPQTE